ncbi:MAG: ATP-dependent DNA helicase [Gammaproteobacteria bacterium]|nr:MAG: ATP-dependent DNA helicase [Gammaproteobacteria bacterium]
MSILTDASSLLGAEGPFTHLLDNYRVRESQLQMASRIELAIADKEILIAESGTGTGKTLAYLVPALLSGKKVLVSTGTRHLQDQLYKQDLPLVRRALEVPASMALLKGRSNYLCRLRLEQAELDQSGYRPYPHVDLAVISKWSLTTLHGDIAEVSGVPEQSRVWSDVTSTVDNCIGMKCRHYDDCFVNTARKDAMEADILVINHHLFLADVALKEEGFGQLLPKVDVVILDEAHQVPDTASMYFSTGVSQRQILDLCRDAQLAEVAEKSGIAGFQSRVDELEKLAKECRLAMGVSVSRGSWSQLEAISGFTGALESLKQGLQQMLELLKSAAVTGDQLENCYERTQVLVDRLAALGIDSNEEFIRWYETSKTGFRLHSTPLSIADKFRELVCEQDRSVIFTSATLAVSGSFAHYQQQLGLEDASTGIWPGPFNYTEQALFYLPEGLPEPGDSDHTTSVVELAEKLIKISRGRVFMLFTSYRALNEAASKLEGRLDYPLLVQGEAPRHELLERFRNAGDAVLLGTGSFWEGVDVKGDALTVVMIDKFPFAAPDDPVLQARCKAARSAGLNPFMTLQLPQAVVALRQGAGRLIRSVDDQGVFILCDSRLVSKSYGKIFTRSLPAMKRTRDFAEVSAFLERS